MALRRTYSSYDDGCATAHALDILGERWALIVVRELLLGPKRFRDLQRDIIGIGPTALSQRLHELEQSGVLVRRDLPEPARVAVYDLTPWGHQLEAVNAALSQWAVGSPRLPTDAGMSPDTVVLAMRAHARPGAADPVRTVGLSLTDSRLEAAAPAQYVATVSPTRTAIEKRPVPEDVDAEIAATTAAWKACIIEGADPSETSGITVSGDAGAVRALVAATRFQP